MRYPFCKLFYKSNCIILEEKIQTAEDLKRQLRMTNYKLGLSKNPITNQRRTIKQPRLKFLSSGAVLRRHSEAAKPPKNPDIQTAFSVSKSFIFLPYAVAKLLNLQTSNLPPLSPAVIQPEQSAVLLKVFSLSVLSCQINVDVSRNIHA